MQGCLGICDCASFAVIRGWHEWPSVRSSCTAVSRWRPGGTLAHRAETHVDLDQLDSRLITDADIGAQFGEHLADLVLDGIRPRGAVMEQCQMAEQVLIQEAHQIISGHRGVMVKLAVRPDRAPAIPTEAAIDHGGVILTLQFCPPPRKSDSGGSYDLTSVGLQERGDQDMKTRRNHDAGFKPGVALEADPRKAASEGEGPRLRDMRIVGPEQLVHALKVQGPLSAPTLPRPAEPALCPNRHADSQR
jgi:hypothetical protein